MLQWFYTILNSSPDFTPGCWHLFSGKELFFIHLHKKKFMSTEKREEIQLFSAVG